MGWLMFSRTKIAGMLVALLATITGCGAGDEDNSVSSPAPFSASSQPVSPVYTGQADPVRLRIPSIGVDANFQRLETNSVGILSPPTNNDDVGWWVDGPEPGESGASVVAGHVDSYRGPAVLFRLRDLRQGAEILIDTADGGQVRFKVDSVERFPKDRFPTDRVYAPTQEPTLRVVTCGGAFNRTERSYRDNVIAFATIEE